MELRSFLSLCNVFRRFVPNFSRVVSPLDRKLRIDQPTSFPFVTPAEKDAVENFMALLTNPPILAFPRTTGNYTVDTDTCHSHLRLYLLQQQKDGTTTQPIGYWSLTLSSGEQNLASTHEGCLAIVLAVLLLRPYLELIRFITRTEHEALESLLRSANASGKLARWQLRLLEFDF